ncbi:THO complex subunit 4B [Morus notabilis]|uniref:THO complex subunit 4B n=1 Tax=Morus notabilis TaxID=981085 RepID=UPI000CED6E97|nr:THO complex subunit 4B [Morus notabilis]
MQDFLDMSLDDLIAKNKKPGGYNRNANFRPKDRDRTARVAGSGPDRRFLNRLSARTTPYSLIQEKVVLSGGGSKAQEGTKLYISNLNSDVSNDDLEILFSDVGEVMQNTIHYDKNGKSKGTAEVVFVHYLDALAAIKRYDTVRLDGKPLKIELVGVNVVTPHALPPTGDGILGKPISAFKRGPGHGHGHGKMDIMSLLHGNNGSGRGRSRGPQLGRIHNENKVTAEDLDAELEKYRLEALQIK